MKPLFIAIALSTGLALSPASAERPNIDPKLIQVDSSSEEPEGGLSAQERTARAQNAKERARLAAPMDKMPQKIERRYKRN